jgi:hypothetical protein
LSEGFLAAIEENETEVRLQFDDEGELTIEIRAGGWTWICHIPDPLHFDPPSEMEEELMVACTALLETIIQLFESN